jgi:hypothetical protein
MQKPLKNYNPNFTLFRLVGICCVLFKYAWSAQCMNEVHPECGEKFFAYNSTFYPNLLGHWTPAESTKSFSKFYPLRQMQCSEHLDLFLCSTLSPACVNEELSGKFVLRNIKISLSKHFRNQ